MGHRDATIVRTTSLSISIETNRARRQVYPRSLHVLCNSFLPAATERVPPTTCCNVQCFGLRCRYLAVAPSVDTILHSAAPQRSREHREKRNPRRRTLGKFRTGRRRSIPPCCSAAQPSFPARGAAYLPGGEIAEHPNSTRVASYRSSLQCRSGSTRPRRPTPPRPDQRRLRPPVPGRQFHPIQVCAGQVGSSGGSGGGRQPSSAQLGAGCFN